MPEGGSRDARVRAAAFVRLAELKQLHGEVLPFDVLREGFSCDGERIAFVNRPRGIWRPRQCAWPLSLKTSPPRADNRYGYGDAWSDARGGLLYDYRDRNPDLPENRALAAAGPHRVPLIYFFGVARARYLAEFPVFVVHADDLAGRVVLHPEGADRVAEGEEALREYRIRGMRARLHQARFRERVLDAYRSQCALCRLRLRPLLDAAHILPDSEGGRPAVSNGLSLCRIHHAAFDRMFLGIRPEGRIEIHTSILHEEDGPMLRYGLQELHGLRIEMPRRPGDRPDPEALGERYERFRLARPGS